MKNKQREFIVSTTQQIEYYVMWALEGEFINTQACWIQIQINKRGSFNFTVKQVSGALQRLKKQGLVKYDGCWRKA